MSQPLWRRRSLIAILATMLGFQAQQASAVALSLCSTQNTGANNLNQKFMFMSDGKCSDNCKGGNYAFAITQYQSCYCSNVAPSNTVSIGQCNTPCPGYGYEQCGNQDAGTFGYIQLKTPTSTASVAGSGGLSQDASSVQAPESSAIIQSIVHTTTNVIVSTAPPSSQAPVTIIQTADPSPPTPIVIIDTPVSSSKPASTSWTPTVVLATSVVTVSGAVSTRIETTTPTVSPSSGLSQELPQRQQSKSLSSGAAAGITIGAVVGALLLGALMFLCWRRRRHNSSDNEGGMVRNPSVLSRVGLLRNDREDVGIVAPGPTLPRIRTTGIAAGNEPNSAHTIGSSMSENRRYSRPMFVDNRLNPNALMPAENPSRTSIGTLRDEQDYSRPLEVKNPDA